MNNGQEMPIAVRAYVPVEEQASRLRGGDKRRLRPSGYTLILDTETTTDEAQQIRIGSYQIRSGMDMVEEGFFFDPESLSNAETETLHRYAETRGRIVRTLAEFIDGIFYPYGYDARATIVGFNLPFDLSRLAYAHGSARGKMMRGGFTFKFSTDRYRSAVQIKHLSRRAAVIRFTAPARQRTPRGQRKRKMPVQAHRGVFVDLRTIAAALTSRSFSLGSLGEFLGVDSDKLSTEEHGGPLTEDYLAYAERDVQTSWECFLRLRDRYSEHRLTATPLHAIYSEAGLGKAYLKEMGICPWREAQPDMPQEMIGAIVSSYYGGRSEVHIRRQIEQIAYCDFLSMYPTVCVLMGLWHFVIAQGTAWEETTEAVQNLLDHIKLDDLQQPAFWPRLAVLVEIAPRDDLFPVRARYGTEGHYTIGLNHLTSDAPLWFTLADCIAAKLLSGEVPRILRAVRFKPSAPQNGLRVIEIAGRREYRVDPAREDFYRRLIDLRTATRQEMASASGAERDRLDAAQMALKILANSTSYGIFFELNVEDLPHPESALCHARHKPGFVVETTQIETPGRYFHPLLATLITGAARLMLAIAERRTLDAGLDWVFCDTDSIAIAKPASMRDDCFFAAVDTIRNWFTPLNPYAAKGSILKLEDANHGIHPRPANNRLEPLYCLAISAKRYALFNISHMGQPIIRKASAHGLGHLIAPYAQDGAPPDLPAPMMPLDQIGVDLWQHDVWHRIIAAARDQHPAQVRIGDLPGFDTPAVSRYAATTPTLLRWFKAFNRGKIYRWQVRPFGFMLAFLAKGMADLPPQIMDQATISAILPRPRSCPARKRLDAPRAVAPFDRDLVRAASQCFDRDTGQPVPAKLLKSYAQALRRYHLHPEAKFLGGDYTNAGPTQRRHIQTTGVHLIGKEANRWEEQFYLGADPEAEVDYGLQPDQRDQVMAIIRAGAAHHGLRAVARAGHVRKHLLAQAIKGAIMLPDAVIARLAEAAGALDRKERTRQDREAARIAALRDRVARQGLRQVAAEMNISAGHLSRVLAGERRCPASAPIERSPSIT